MSSEVQTDRKEIIRLLESVESNANPQDGSTSTWTKEETNELLKLISELNLLFQLENDDQDAYNKLSEHLNKSDIKEHWLELKSKWVDYKNGGTEHFEHFTEMEILFSEPPQNEHISSKPEIIVIHGEELYNTNLTYDDCIVPKIKSRNWSTKETECVMQVLEKYGMPNRDTLKKISYIMMEHLKQNGYIRTEEQIQIKIKNLRRYFFQVIRKDISESEFPFFQRMKVLMSQQVISEDSVNNSDDGQEEQEFFLHKRRQMWSPKETNAFLEFIEDNNIVTGKQLNRLINEAIEYLDKKGYKRTQAQLLVRWKNIKTAYWTALRKKSKFPDRELQFFTRLHNILNPTNEEVHLGSIFQVKNNASSEDSNEVSRETDFISVENSYVPEVAVNVDYDPLVTNNSKEMEMPVKRTKLDVNTNACSTYTSMDSIDHYCISLSSSIKKLDARKQAKLKIEIMQLLYKAEFDPNF